MSELALQLIAQNKRTKDTYLDLGNCGLTELPDELFECVWLETLVLSNAWWEYENGEWVENKVRIREKRISFLHSLLNCTCSFHQQ